MGKEKVVCSVQKRAGKMVHRSDVVSGYLLDRERV